MPKDIFKPMELSAEMKAERKLKAKVGWWQDYEDSVSKSGDGQIHYDACVYADEEADKRGEPNPETMALSYTKRLKWYADYGELVKGHDSEAHEEARKSAEEKRSRWGSDPEWTNENESVNEEDIFKPQILNVEQKEVQDLRNMRAWMDNYWFMAGSNRRPNSEKIHSEANEYANDLQSQRATGKRVKNETERLRKSVQWFRDYRSYIAEKDPDLNDYCAAYADERTNSGEEFEGNESVNEDDIFKPMKLDADQKMVMKAKSMVSDIIDTVKSDFERYDDSDNEEIKEEWMDIQDQVNSELDGWEDEDDYTSPLVKHIVNFWNEHPGNWRDGAWAVFTANSHGQVDFEGIMLWAEYQARFEYARHPVGYYGASEVLPYKGKRNESVSEEDIFRPMSRKEQGELKNKRKADLGGEYPFLEHLQDWQAFLDGSSTNLIDIPYQGRYDSEVSIRNWEAEPLDPEFMIYYDSEQVAEYYLTKLEEESKLVDEVRAEVEEENSYYSRNDEEIKKKLEEKGWKHEGGAYTGNEDSYYFWGDDDIGYEWWTTDKEDRVVLVTSGFGNRQYDVYDEEAWQEFYSLQSMDRNYEIAAIMGYQEWDEMISDMREWRNDKELEGDPEDFNKEYLVDEIKQKSNSYSDEELNAMGNAALVDILKDLRVPESPDQMKLPGFEAKLRGTIGKLGFHGLKESRLNETSYSGVFLTEESRKELLSKFEIPEGWEVIADHMTINLGGLKDPSLLGQEATMKVVSFAADNKVMAVLVETDVPSDNAKKHITVAVNRNAGGRARDSNDLKGFAPLNPFELKGKISEVSEAITEAISETGEPDQNYDHDFFNDIVEELDRAGFPGARHKEFDKYQGVYLKVPGIDTFWVKDVTDYDSFHSYYFYPEKQPYEDISVDDYLKGRINANDLIAYCRRIKYPPKEDPIFKPQSREDIIKNSESITEAEDEPIDEVEIETEAEKIESENKIPIAENSDDVLVKIVTIFKEEFGDAEIDLAKTETGWEITVIGVSTDSKKWKDAKKRIEDEIGMDDKITVGQKNDDGMLSVAESISESRIFDARNRRDKCMQCDAPPTKDVLWAEGHGHAWFCDKHYQEWSTTGDGKGDVCALKDITDGEASKKFQDNKNPNLLKESLEDLDDVIDIQLAEPTVATDSYMQGLANGLLVAKACVTDTSVDDLGLIEHEHSDECDCEDKNESVKEDFEDEHGISKGDVFKPMSDEELKELGGPTKEMYEQSEVAAVRVVRRAIANTQITDHYQEELDEKYDEDEEAEKDYEIESDYKKLTRSWKRDYVWDDQSIKQIAESIVDIWKEDPSAKDCSAVFANSSSIGGRSMMIEHIGHNEEYYWDNLDDKEYTAIVDIPAYKTNESVSEDDIFKGMSKSDIRKSKLQTAAELLAKNKHFTVEDLEYKLQRAYDDLRFAEEEGGWEDEDIEYLSDKINFLSDVIKQRTQQKESVNEEDIFKPMSKEDQEEQRKLGKGKIDRVWELAIEAARQVLLDAQDDFANANDDIPDDVWERIKAEFQVGEVGSLHYVESMAAEITEIWVNNPEAEDMVVYYGATPEGRVWELYVGPPSFYQGDSYQRYPYRAMANISSIDEEMMESFEMENIIAIHSNNFLTMDEEKISKGGDDGRSDKERARTG